MEEIKTRLGSAYVSEALNSEGSYSPESWRSQLNNNLNGIAKEGEAIGNGITRHETRTVRTVITSGGRSQTTVHTTSSTQGSVGSEEVDELHKGDKETQDQVTILEGVDNPDKRSDNDLTSLKDLQQGLVQIVDTDRAKMEAGKTDQADEQQSKEEIKSIIPGQVSDAISEAGANVQQEALDAQNYVVTVVSEVETTVERTYFLTDSGREEMVEEKEVGKTCKTKYHVDEHGKVVDSEGEEQDAVEEDGEEKEKKDKDLEANIKEFDEQIKVVQDKSLTESGQDVSDAKVGHTSASTSKAVADVVDGKVMVEKLGALEADQSDEGSELFGSCVLIKSNDLVDFINYPVQEWVYISQEKHTKEITEQLLLLSTELYKHGGRACTIL